VKSVEQISRGVANFFDAEVRPSLSGGKQILYGIAVGRIAANAPALVTQYAPILSPLGILQGDMIDAEGLAAELRNQMARSGGQLNVPIMNDTFIFKPQDVDTLMRHIERA
jgi:hypothetical protein